MEKLVQRLVRDELKYRKKLLVLEYARGIGNNAEACRDFNIPDSSFYEWKKAYEKEGKAGLRRKRPVAYSHPKKIPIQVAEKILQIRRAYQLGPERIMWYLERYHGISVSESTVYRILARNGLNRLAKTAPRRALHTKRYAKTVPGHHIQVDVKFLTLKDDEGHKVRRYQYTAIDDATRVRALQIYRKHNQQCAIEFINYVIEKFPFRINTIRTDRGHEFQAKFHWHVEDQGMKHVYIKPRSPQLNGKVERSHRTDQQEFYQLLTYTDDVDLNRKLEAWEQFYNYDRPHGAFAGKTPYEVLRSLLN
ncbi:MAG: IS481 family transposase [Candidatus Marinimicrobia bacterium]|nr:IS481 family transposase [Candidatus Neomarinimicrobiota bacterium]